MKREAMFWEVIDKNKKIVQCNLCPNLCNLKEGQVGKCNVRKNFSGELKSLVFEKPCSISIDNIEKKPLYHFLPNKKTLNIATAGCNLNCRYCNNWETSQNNPNKLKSLNFSSREVVKTAIKKKTKIISYTYSEPKVFYEYMLQIAKLAKKAGVKNISVTNGYINPKPLEILCHVLDASNIDLKSMDDDFYREVCKGKLEPVLNTIKTMKKNGVWIEITNLLIPGLNDSEEQIIKLVDWIRKNLGTEVPLHFTGFHPSYKMQNLPPTSSEKVKKARRIAMSRGLKYVYTGNISDEEGSSTYCPNCKEILIKRKFFEVIENKVKKGRCSYCEEKIAGVWE